MGWWPGTESNRRRQPFQGYYSAVNYGTRSLLDVQAQVITRSILQVLFEPEVQLGCHHRTVPQRELDLFEVSVTLMRQPRECPAQVVRSNLRAEQRRVAFHNGEDGLG